MQHYMLASVLSTQGSWHAQLAGLPYDAAGQLRDDPKIKAVAVQQEIGYARLPNRRTTTSRIGTSRLLDDGSASPAGYPAHRGGPHASKRRRAPRAGTRSDQRRRGCKGGGIPSPCPSGDRLARRRFPLTQTNPYNEEEPETIRIRETKAYTVVGICSRPSLEPYSAPGFTAFSALDTAALASTAR